MSQFGYAGKILVVDLSNGQTRTLPTNDYAPLFLGGRGIAAKLYWDLVPPETRALDPGNCIICASGPLTGFNGLASGRWTICAKSAAGEPEAFTHGNLGGRWGATLKYAGYDALAVTGRAEKPVYVFIHDGQVEIKDASDLWGKTTFESQETIAAKVGRNGTCLDHRSSR